MTPFGGVALMLSIALAAALLLFRVVVVVVGAVVQAVLWVFVGLFRVVAACRR